MRTVEEIVSFDGQEKYPNNHLFAVLVLYGNDDYQPGDVLFASKPISRAQIEALTQELKYRHRGIWVVMLFNNELNERVYAMAICQHKGNAYRAEFEVEQQIANHSWHEAAEEREQM